MPSKRLLTTAVLTAAVAGGGLVGALVGAPVLSGAQEPTVSEAPATGTPAAPTPDGQDPAAPPADGQRPPKGDRGQRPDGPHQANGKTEAVLTGTEAEKVTAAALAEVPGATVDRVETDVDGDSFEAHITKSDGSKATVKFDANFAVTSVQDGMR